MKKRYLFCTIAINKSYLDYALKFANELYIKSPSTKVLIVSDINDIVLPNVIYHKIPDNFKTKLLNNNIFNYNLKFYPILKSLDEDFDFIFFKDCDWEIHDGYDDIKFDELIDVFDNSGIDCFYERPYSIKAKHENDCIFKHKIQIFNLMNTNKYDNGVVPIEQFILFRKNDKLQKFCESWSEKEKLISENNIHPWAEGLEIGMSLIDANMTYKNHNFREISNCFKFVTHNIKHYRY